MHTSYCTLTGQQLFHMTQPLHYYVQLVYDCSSTHQPVAVKQDPPQLSASSQSLLHFSQFQSSQCHATLHWGRKPSHWCSRGMLLMPFSDSMHITPQWVSVASQYYDKASVSMSVQYDTGMYIKLYEGTVSTHHKHARTDLQILPHKHS